MWVPWRDELPRVRSSAVNTQHLPSGTTPWRLWDGFWDDLRLQNHSVLPSLGRRDGSKGTKGIPRVYPIPVPGPPVWRLDFRVPMSPSLPHAEIKVIKAKSRLENPVPPPRSPDYGLLVASNQGHKMLSVPLSRFTDYPLGHVADLSELSCSQLLLTSRRHLKHI